MGDFRTRCAAFAERMATIAYYDEALLALLVSNDTRAKAADSPPYIQDAISLLRRKLVSRVINIVVFASFIGFLGSAIAVCTIRIVKSFLREDGPEVLQLLRTAFRLGLNSSMILLFVLSIPVISAVLIRIWRRSDQKWQSLYSSSAGFPFLQVFWVSISVFAIGGALQVVYYLTIQLFPTLIWHTNQIVLTGIIAGIFKDFFTNLFVNQIAISIIGALLALALCYYLDRFLAKGWSPLYFLAYTLFVLALLLSTFVVVQIILPSAGYFDENLNMSGFIIRRYDNLLADCAAIFVFVGLFMITIARQLKSLPDASG